MPCPMPRVTASGVKDPRLHTTPARRLGEQRRENAGSHAAAVLPNSRRKMKAQACSCPSPEPLLAQKKIELYDYGA